MFKLVKQPAAWWPCRWSSAADEGAVAVNEIALRFKRLDEDEFAAVFGIDTSAMDREAVRAHNLKAFETCVAGWRGVVDDGGQPVTMTDATAAQLLIVPNFVGGFTEAFVRFHRAIPEETAKNSGASPAGGPATGDAETAGRTATGAT